MFWEILALGCDSMWMLALFAAFKLVETAVVEYPKNHAKSNSVLDALLARDPVEYVREQRRYANLVARMDKHAIVHVRLSPFCPKAAAKIIDDAWPFHGGDKTQVGIMQAVLMRGERDEE